MGLINEPRLLFSDIFLLDVAQAFGRSIRLMTVEIGHDWAGHGDDQTRREANQHEFSMVFADKAGNWRPSYRELHDGVVAETVSRIRANLRREGSPMGKASPAGGQWNKLTPEGFREELIEKAGIARSVALLLSRSGSSIGKDLGCLFERLVEVRPPAERNLVLEGKGHTLAYGDSADTKFMHRLLRRYQAVRAVILDEDRYSRLISPYFLARHAMQRPGVIVLVGRRAELRGADDRQVTNGFDATTKFVNGLISGEIDGIEHEIYTLTRDNGERIYYEIVI